MRRGFTLVEVLVALVLVAVVGGTLLRYLAFSAQAEAASSARRGLAELARFASLRLSLGDPLFLPPQGSQERLYDYGSLGRVFSGPGGVNLANPDLYRLRVSREGEGSYTLEVCYRAPSEECLRLGGLRASSSGRGGGEGGVASGTLALLVEAPPSLTVVEVAVSGPSWSGTVSAPGSYSLTVPPGTYTVSARTVSLSGVPYEPSPALQTVSVSAGGVGEASVRYTCPGGVVRYTVTEGFSATLRGDSSWTLSGSGSLVVPSGSYRVEAQDEVRDYTYRASVEPASFQLAPCAAQEVRVGFAPVDGRLTVEGEAQGGSLRPGEALQAMIRPTNASVYAQRDLTYSALMPPGTASASALQTTLKRTENGMTYSVIFDRVSADPVSATVSAGQETRVRLAYKALPYKTCLYLYDGANPGSYFTSGSFRLKVWDPGTGETVLEETFVLSGYCRNFTLPPGAYRLRVEQLGTLLAYAAEVSWPASSTTPTSPQSSSVTLRPTRAILSTYVTYSRPSTEAGYDGRGGEVSFTAGGETFTRGGSPYGGLYSSAVQYSVPPNAPLAYAPSPGFRVYLDTRTVLGVSYEYYWQLKGVSLPASTPQAGGTATAYIDWTLFRCQVASSSCQVWNGFSWASRSR